MDATNNLADHRRRSIRLSGYDYRRAGAYFITVCTHNRTMLFGEIREDETILNDAGPMVRECWDAIPNHYPHAKTDAFIVMPNHVHGIIMLVDTHDVGAGLRPAPTPAGNKRHPLSEIIRAFKSFSARRINEHRGLRGVPVWQRNYYEHIIRNESALHDIRHYIVNNPDKWADDPNNPRNIQKLS